SEIKMKKITLERPEENFNKRCAYDIVLDGEQKTVLNNGDKKVVELKAQSATIQAKLWWCGSEPVTISNISETSRVQISGNKFLNWLMPLLSVLVLLTTTVIQNMAGVGFKPVAISIIVVMLSGILASLTIWRNKWIRVTVI
ncbi:MAG: hypothetical protein P8X57_16210, partial [Cyclobacteriaceae bacterium]